jgi:23S rRNA pseudouridine1911/1915/1917 synthase
MKKRMADAAGSIAQGLEGPSRSARVPPELAGARLDVAAARLFDGLSRSRLQEWIEQGVLRINGAPAERARQIVVDGDELELHANVEERSTDVTPQAIDLRILYADDHIAVIDKPAGLTVHPGAGQPDGTLQNALLHRFPQTAAVPRAGIVHRLDKETSGILIVALTPASHLKLADAIAERAVRREYDALVAGVLSGGGRVDASIGRHPRDRTKMAVLESGRPAITHYRIAERFRFHTHLHVKLETGRTHQIRVHMAHIKHPIVGDPVYSPRAVRGRGLDPALRERLSTFPRQALHARELEIVHPVSGERMQWTAGIPADMQRLLTDLRNDAAQNTK